MKCPICGVDHFMLCHGCKHNNQLVGLAYKGSPCEACDKGPRGKKRQNDSRESGHGRVVSLEQIERYVSETIPADMGEEAAETFSVLLLEFVRRFCTLPIRTQYMFEQRFFFGLSLEETASMVRSTFEITITPAGVSAALKSARARMRLSSTT
jgi:DNA-directed RNA polymerase specialized sigma24 family protein